MSPVELPRISVVTSCFNAAEFVEATIRSVVQQQYPKLEYIFVDGASKDSTLQIAQRYSSEMSALISEPDDGQYHGIQKGLAGATGEVMAWLNGDDIYCPWTLSIVGELFARFPKVEWVVGTPSLLNEAGQCVRVSGNAGTAYPRDYIRNGWFKPAVAGYLQQESMFWRRGLWDRVGGLDLQYGLAADFDLWRRFAEYAELHSVNVPLAMFRKRLGAQRSSVGNAEYEGEVERICAGLARPPAAWLALSSSSEALMHLCRMALWKRSPVLAYSVARAAWIQTRSLRPLARTSWADLLTERALRSAPMA